MRRRYWLPGDVRTASTAPPAHPHSVVADGWMSIAGHAQHGPEFQPASSWHSQPSHLVAGLQLTLDASPESVILLHGSRSWQSMPVRCRVDWQPHSSPVEEGHQAGAVPGRPSLLLFDPGAREEGDPVRVVSPEQPAPGRHQPAGSYPSACACLNARADCIGAASRFHCEPFRREFAAFHCTSAASRIRVTSPCRWPSGPSTGRGAEHPPTGIRSPG